MSNRIVGILVVPIIASLFDGCSQIEMLQNGKLSEVNFSKRTVDSYSPEIAKNINLNLDNIGNQFAEKYGESYVKDSQGYLMGKNSSGEVFLYSYGNVKGLDGEEVTEWGVINWADNTIKSDTDIFQPVVKVDNGDIGYFEGDVFNSIMVVRPDGKYDLVDPEGNIVSNMAAEEINFWKIKAVQAGALNPVTGETATIEPTIAPTETATATATETATATPEVVNDLLKDIIPLAEVKKNIEWFMRMSPEEIEKYVKDKGGLFGYGDPVSTLPLGMTAHEQITEGPISTNGYRLGYISTRDDGNDKDYISYGLNAILLGFVGKEFDSQTQVFTVLGIQDGCGNPHAFVGYLGPLSLSGDNSGSYQIYPTEARRGNFLNLSFGGTGIGLEDYLLGIGKNSINEIVAVHQFYIRSGPGGYPIYSETFHSKNTPIFIESLKNSIINGTCIEEGSLDPVFFDEMSLIDANEVDLSEFTHIPFVTRLISQ